MDRDRRQSNSEVEELQELADREYEFGFVTDVERMNRSSSSSSGSRRSGTGRR